MIDLNTSLLNAIAEVQKAFVDLKARFDFDSVTTGEGVEGGRFVMKESFGRYTFEQSEPENGEGVNNTLYSVGGCCILQYSSLKNETVRFNFFGENYAQLVHDNEKAQKAHGNK